MFIHFRKYPGLFQLERSGFTLHFAPPLVLCNAAITDFPKYPAPVFLPIIIRDRKNGRKKAKPSEHF